MKRFECGQNFDAQGLGFALAASICTNNSTDYMIIDATSINIKHSMHRQNLKPFLMAWPCGAAPCQQRHPLFLVHPVTGHQRARWVPLQLHWWVVVASSIISTLVFFNMCLILLCMLLQNANAKFQSTVLIFLYFFWTSGNYSDASQWKRQVWLFTVFRVPKCPSWHFKWFVR